MPVTVRQRSFYNKNGSKKTAALSKGTRKLNEGVFSEYGEYLVTDAPTDLRGLAYPGGAMALGLLLVARILSAIYGIIADCDETYNYWEPLHYIIYGTGLQTWEYSPSFAIRSYTPLWLFALPGKLLSWIMAPVTVFYSLRVLLAIFSSVAELMFYKAICHEFGVNVGRVWLLVTLPLAGMFLCSAAMLPSAWSNALVSAALACWWRRRYPPAIFLIAFSAIISWPFTALLGLPIAIDMLFIKRQIFDFIKWSVISFLVLLLPTVAIDSWYYGKLTIAPWNIVVYNIFTEHGPSLYGVEPWTYYFVNGFLNFNVVWAYGLACPIQLMICVGMIPKAQHRASFCAPYWLDLMPMLLWLLVFMFQPHKEERFLYPIYSLIVLACAITLDCMQKMLYAAGTEIFRWEKAIAKRHYLEFSTQILTLCATVAWLGGISRICALYTNYHGSMTILSNLPPAPDTTIPLNVCFGKEWYRSPSSFHLPPSYVTRFIASEFDGQMPAPFSTQHNATRLTPPHFNDQNKGDNRTYLTPNQCHYLVDSDIGNPSELQPPYYKDSSWQIVATVPLLDSSKSNKFYRAFYIPFLSNKNTVFGNLYLLKNKVVI